MRQTNTAKNRNEVAMRAWKKGACYIKKLTIVSLVRVRDGMMRGFLLVGNSYVINVTFDFTITSK